MEDGNRIKTRLTDHEIKVLQLVAQGINNEGIGEELGVDGQSVSTYVYKIRCKLGLSDRKAMMTLSSEQIEAYRRPIIERLTNRQREIACLIAEGLLDTEIAEKLHIGLNTLSVCISTINKKLGLKNRVQLARWVFQQEWVKVPSPMQSVSLPARVFVSDTRHKYQSGQQVRCVNPRHAVYQQCGSIDRAMGHIFEFPAYDVLFDGAEKAVPMSEKSLEEL